MAAQAWTAPLLPFAPGASTAKNTFTAATDLPCGENAAAFPIIPGGTLVPGTMIRVEAGGVFSNTGTPTLAIGLYYGLVAGTALAVTTTITTTTGATNWPWRFYYWGRVTNTGTSGSIMGHGELWLATSLTAMSQNQAPTTAMAAVTIDTTTSKQLSIGASWGASSASNTITCHYMIPQIIG